jgi:hypothetical protein
MPNDPTVTLNFTPIGPKFSISEDAAMPVITATATLGNVAAGPGIGTPIYTWTASLNFRGASVPFGALRNTAHRAIPPVTSPQNTFTIPFTELCGGDLTVSVVVQLGSRTLRASSSNLTIVGTNPSVGKLADYVPNNVAFRKLMQLESGLQQFLPTGYPHFSHDNLGGVGLCQITNPEPTADEIWNWRANVDTGWKVYQEKEKVAAAYPERVRKSEGFRQLVEQYKRERVTSPCDLVGALLDGLPGSGWDLEFLNSPYGNAAVWVDGIGHVHLSQPGLDLWPNQIAAGVSLGVRTPFIVVLPDFAPEQLQRDTIRGFNGYAGAPLYGLKGGLHEYRVKVDRAGKLVVQEDRTGSRGTAEWERIPPGERPARGSPNYVDVVEAQPGF